MSILTFSTCLTVEKFLGEFNWEGRQLETTPETNIRETLWQRLTVEQFFNDNNWYGMEVTAPVRASAVKDFSLTVSVTDFFHSMNWRGKAIIAPTPPPISAKEDHSLAQNFNVNDLSDLF